MLYRPKFCCSCGEKIQRTDLGLFSSRRFCELCETEYKAVDYVPRAIVAVGILLGVIGLASFVRTSPPDTLPSARSVVQKGSAPANAGDWQTRRDMATKTAEPTAANISQPQSEKSVVKADPSGITTGQLAAKKAAEPVYYCEALTKKGTRCTRRIKSPGYCWQHAREHSPPASDETIPKKPQS